MVHSLPSPLPFFLSSPPPVMSVAVASAEPLIWRGVGRLPLTIRLRSPPSLSPLSAPSALLFRGLAEWVVRPMSGTEGVVTGEGGVGVRELSPPLPLSDPPPSSTPSPSLPSSPGGAVSLTVVLKVGSASLSHPDGRFVHLSVMVRLVELICRLIRDGHRVLLVTSGAVAIGCQRMSLSQRPTSLIQKQAIAAIGQSRLMRIYDDLFSQLQQPIAQVLLTRENLRARHHYVNAFNTFTALLDMRVLPIVNENDTVAVEELRVGDNDTLSALVASLVQADFLFLLTDVPSLFTEDPRTHPLTAQPIHVVHNIDELKVDVGGGGRWWGEWRGQCQQ